MHLGNARTAILASRAAREAGGRILLRIDDLDRTRCRPEYETGLRVDLAWLGLDFDPDLRAGIVRQSERDAAYDVALQRLEELGLVYPCYCSRREVRAAVEAPHEEARSSGDHRYPGTCRGLTARDRRALETAGRRPALRLRLEPGVVRYRDGRLGEIAEDVAATVGDLVLRRSDGLFSYQLATVVDDGASGVTHVVRGEDLAASACRQILLQTLLGLPTPAYTHVALARGPDGARLAKRHGTMGVAELRAAGLTPEAVVERALCADPSAS